MSPRVPAIKGLLFDKDGTLFDYQTTWGPWATGFIADLSKGDPHLRDVIAGALEFDLIAGTFRPERAELAPPVPLAPLLEGFTRSLASQQTPMKRPPMGS